MNGIIVQISVWLIIILLLLCEKKKLVIPITRNSYLVCKILRVIWAVFSTTIIPVGIINYNNVYVYIMY